MRTLLVLRHAKSAWGDDTLDDIDRPLNKRGERDIVRIAAHFAETGVAPDLICCSPARRTRATLAAVLPSLKSPTVRFEDALYGATVGDLMAFVRELPTDAGAVMLVGHNPGMGDLVSVLAGDECDFPTGAFATLALPIDAWSLVATGQAQLESLVVPKTLDD